MAVERPGVGDFACGYDKRVRGPASGLLGLAAPESPAATLASATIISTSSLENERSNSMLRTQI